MKYIAHRGVWNKKKEQNTLTSFLLAIKDERFIGFELDVRMSKNKDFFIYHDYLYKGSPIKTYDSKFLKDNNIPTLESILKLDHNKIILIEIKDYDLDVNKFITLLNKYKNEKIYIMSFNNKVIEKIFKKTKKYKIGILNYIINSKEDYQFDFICLLNSTITEKIISKYHSNNIEVFSYGILNKDEMKYKNIKYIIDNKKL